MVRAKTNTKNKRQPKQIYRLPDIKPAVKDSWKIYRRHFWLILLVGLLAVLVNYVLGMLVTYGTPSLVRELWFTIMLAVFVWLAVELSAGKRPAFSAAFYEGSATFIKQFLIIVVWVIYMIPFLIGAGLSYQVGSPRFGANSVEIAIVNMVWVILGVVSAYWVVRSLFAPYLSLRDRPIKAIKDSWKLSKKLVSRLALRLFIGLLVVLIPMVAIYGLLYTPLSDLRFMQWVLATLFEIVLFVFTFPFMVIYIYQLRPHEQSARPRPKTKK